jgi:hypothetical protein
VREPAASHLALAKLCAHPWTSGKPWPWEPQSSFGVFGDRTHLGCEAEVTGEAVFPAVYAGLNEDDQRKLDRCVASARRLLDATPAHEVVAAELDLRWHVESGTVRRAGPDEQRKKRPGEWTARIDWVGIAGGVVLVRDWKTGRQEYTDRAAVNPQVRLCAIAAAQFFGARSASVELVHLDEDDYTIDGADFDPLELAMIAHEMRELRATLLQGPTPPRPGPHCTRLYCKLKGICSATQAALSSAYQLERPLTVKIEDDEQARWTIERLPAAQAALDAIEVAVKEYARARPFDLGDGRLYGWREKEERSVNVATAEREEAVRRVLGHAADFAIRRETTTTLGLLEEGVRIALGAAPPRGAKTETMRRLLAELDSAGGLKVSKYEKAEAFKPKKENHQ